MATPRSIVLISCVKTKRASRAKAKDIYDSTLFRAQRDYAERFSDKWFILSAKYGLLDPEREIGPYEETLKGTSTKQKREWSELVFAELQNQTSPDDAIILTAGEDYCRYLEPLLSKRGNKISRPVKGLSMGYIPGRLRELIASAARQTQALPGQNLSTQVRGTVQPESRSSTAIGGPIANANYQQIDRFYSALAQLQELKGEARPLKSLKPAECPHRGVYFFFEHGEIRADRRTPRVVRVGTHGLKIGSKSTLYGRLAQHRGSASGHGNHRGSVFRLHVGKALINRGLFECQTWAKGSSAPRDVVEAERKLEQEVSRYIGEMEVLLLDVPDEPGPDSQRAFIERNVIGLLSKQEVPSVTWLGHSTNNPAIAQSFLWNVNHIDHIPNDDFIDRFERLVFKQIAT